MNVRLSALVERMRSSLFFVPMAAVFAAAAFGLGVVAVDRRVDVAVGDLPFGFTSTVESARTLLGAIAGATISFAGIAFSVSLLVLQLTSSQYSPRVVHTLFRDPNNKRVMALVIGTFTYCIVVLRSVRSALDDSGEPVIPNLSVAIAVVLGIATILAIVAFIDHNAHTMDVSEILERIHRDTVDQSHAAWEQRDPARPRTATPAPPLEQSSTVRSHTSGWIQQIDTAAILDRMPPGSTAHLHTAAGCYAIAGSPLLTISPPTSDDDLPRAVRAAVVIGHTRTMQQDVTYGLRQTVDIAVKALSPGINDPTTAQDAIYHAAAILAELLRHDPPPDILTHHDRTLVRLPRVSHDDLIRLTFEEPRRAAATQPAVCHYLLDTISMLVEALRADGLNADIVELERQARLVAKGCGTPAPLPDDLAVVRATHARMFGEPCR